MPAVRKSTRSSSRASTTFKEPAALKRLNRSLDGAQQALTELRTHAGRDGAENTRKLHKGLGKFVLGRSPRQRQIRDRTQARLRTGEEGHSQHIRPTIASGRDLQPSQHAPNFI